MSELSPDTRALLRAAREDGPGAAGRAQIWSGVAAKASGGAALGAAAGKAAATAGTAKLFVMGALLGSAVTVGVAGMVLRVGAPHLKPDTALVVRDDTEREVVAPAARAAESPAAAGPAGRAGEEAGRDTPLAAPRSERAHLARPGGHARTNDDSLGREAEFVAEARGAVMRGQPQAALNALHAAHALPAHAMEPEELSLEVRALRELGRLDEANAADARLRARFPDHALAR